MKHISILVPKGAASLACIDGAYNAFTKANEFLERMGKPLMFKVQLVALTNDAHVYERLFTVQPDVTVKDNFKTDLIIIPAVNGDMEKVIEINKDFFPWINKQHADGAEAASLCVGAFLLASTGLLKGKKCATHWLGANDFRKMFPDVELVCEKIITDENGIYSSGGATSFWNLLLYIIEKYTNRDLAITMSKYFEIEIDRYNQSSFIIFQGQKDHEDEHVKQAQEFIEKNYHERITVEQLTTMLALSRRNFERRFKKATSNTVVEYMQRVKIEAAKKGLETGRKNVNELMYEVGYSDTKAFRTVFKRTTGLSPIEYRNKYNKVAVA
ncbi:MAG: helix-turn-helix-domain containing protein AraC type [Chitinophagaceae bacterium]|nr:helix-turn-helix-domain containing protein AraC type [Chitinophagaceae bacterium]